MTGRVGRSRQGMMLGVVLMVVAVVMVLAFMLADASMFNLWMASHNQKAQAAQDLADTLVSQSAMALVNGTAPTWGQTAPYPTMLLQPRTGARGVLTFDPATAVAEGMQMSVNNWIAPGGTNPTLTWTDPLTGVKRNVPSGCVLFSAKAEVDGLRRDTYAIVYFPDFNYALASNGPVDSLGSLLVAGDPVSLPGQNGGNLGSNSVLGTAVGLSGGHITGRIEAPGGIALGTTVVDGTIDHGDLGMPHLQIANFDPTRTPGWTVQPLNSGSTVNCDGFYKATSSVTIGDLALTNSVLYVQGDLHVTGSVQGIGVVFVTGNTEIDGGTSLSSGGNAAMALLSGGDVALGGGGTGTSQTFNGLVYTQGAFAASGITIVGNYIQDSPGATTMLLDNVSAVQSSAYQQFNLNVNNPAPPPPPNPYGPPQFTLPVGMYDTTPPAINTNGTAIPLALTGVGVSIFLNPLWNGVPSTAPSGTKYLWIAFLPGQPPTPQQPIVVSAAIRSFAASLPQNPSVGPTICAVNPVVTTSGSPSHPQYQVMQGPTGDPFWAICMMESANTPPLPTPSPTPPPAKGAPAGTVPWSFDINQFISPADSMKVLFWEND